MECAERLYSCLLQWADTAPAAGLPSTRSHVRRALVGRAALVTVCALLLVSPALGDEQSAGHFKDPEQDCRVHLPRNAATTTPPAVTGESWQGICRVSHYMTGTPPAHFDPSVQYPGVQACGEEEWPRCVPGCPSEPDCPEPDRGYRYPIVDNIQATRTHQDPATDWWSVCANSDLSEIVSVPGNRDCGTGLQEVGQCQASAAYYEKLGSNPYPGETFYSFVLTHPDCEPCGHDLLSLILTCKETCKHYFGNLGFDQEGPGNGVWRDGNDPAWPEDRPHRFEDVALHLKEIAGTSSVAGKTALEACIDFCGPRSDDCDPPSPTCEPAAHQAPPWVSKNRYNPTEEKDNQWYWTTYARPRNPNDSLAGWIRTYGVNTDHYSLTSKCVNPIIGQYCNMIIPNGTPNGDEKQRECNKALLPGTVDLDGDGNEDGEILLGLKARGPVDTRWNLAEDGFCHAFSHAHMFCRDCCHGAGGNGEKTTHVCGLDATHVGLVGLPGSYCDKSTAQCK